MFVPENPETSISSPTPNGTGPTPFDDVAPSVNMSADVAAVVLILSVDASILICPDAPEVELVLFDATVCVAVVPLKSPAPKPRPTRAVSLPSVNDDGVISDAGAGQ